MSRPDTWNDMPMCECPHCGGEFQWDYYEVEDDDEHECPICEETIHVVAVDHSTFVRLSVTPNPRGTPR
jgi:NAD-dependent SIR2 family protein deacetylase